MTVSYWRCQAVSTDLLCGVEEPDLGVSYPLLLSDEHSEEEPTTNLAFS